MGLLRDSDGGVKRDQFDRQNIRRVEREADQVGLLAQDGQWIVAVVAPHTECDGVCLSVGEDVVGLPLDVGDDARPIGGRQGVGDAERDLQGVDTALAVAELTDGPHAATATDGNQQVAQGGLRQLREVGIRLAVENLRRGNSHLMPLSGLSQS